MTIRTLRRVALILPKVAVGAAVVWLAFASACILLAVRP